MEKDRTEKYQTRLEAVLNENAVNVSGRTLAMSPIAPKLKGLVQLHKEARPMVPLANGIQCLCYKIAKISDEFLKENRGAQYQEQTGTDRGLKQTEN